jgi:hypothetical protein
MMYTASDDAEESVPTRRRREPDEEATARLASLLTELIHAVGELAALNEELQLPASSGDPLDAKRVQKEAVDVASRVFEFPEEIEQLLQESNVSIEDFNLPVGSLLEKLPSIFPLSVDDGLRMLTEHVVVSIAHNTIDQLVKYGRDDGDEGADRADRDKETDWGAVITIGFFLGLAMAAAAGGVVPLAPMDTEESVGKILDTAIMRFASVSSNATGVELELYINRPSSRSLSPNAEPEPSEPTRRLSRWGSGARGIAEPIAPDPFPDIPESLINPGMPEGLEPDVPNGLGETAPYGEVEIPGGIIDPNVEDLGRPVRPPKNAPYGTRPQGPNPRTVGRDIGRGRSDDRSGRGGGIASR